MRIGIDLGGTKTEILCLGTDGRELIRRRTPTIQGDYDQTLKTICTLICESEKELNCTGRVGIGIPGAISQQNGRVKNANSVWLIGRPLKEDLESRLGREVRLANDANCFALSETLDGAATGAQSVFGVILGTGVGGAVVLNGRLHEGHNRNAGEWGHNPLPWPNESERPGPPCYCGLKGCIETFLSGPALEKELEKACGKPVQASDISELPANITEPIIEIFEDRLARCLATVINSLDPEVIVLGGGLSNIERFYETVPTLWHKWVFGPECSTRLVQAKHGDSSGVRGAAHLWG